MLLGEIKQLDLDADVTVNIPESEAPLWQPNIVYDIPFEVIYNHNIYACIVDMNLEKRPDLHSSSNQTPQYWVLKGPTNAYAAVDGQISTPTTNPTDAVFTIENFSNIYGIGYFDAGGSTISADFYDASNNLIYTETRNIAGFDFSSLYNFYFTTPTGGSASGIFTGFPVNSVKAVITLAGTNVTLGELTVINNAYKVGKALYNSNTKVQIFSRAIYEDDEFGVPRYVYRPARVNATFELFGERVYIESIFKAIKTLSGRRVVYQAQEGRSITTGIGLLRNLEFPVEFPSGYRFSAEVEGVQ